MCTCVCTYMYICARVCTVHVRVYIYVLCVHVFVSVGVFLCVCACMCGYVCTCACVRVCIHMCTVHTCSHACVCAYVYVYTCVHACTRVFHVYSVFVCTGMCAYVCVCTHAHPRALCFLKAFASLGGFDQKDCIGPSFSLPDTGVKQPLAAGLAKDTPLDRKLLSKGDTVSKGRTPHSPGSRPPLARAARTGREGPARPSFSLFPSDRLADSYFPEGP